MNSKSVTIDQQQTDDLQRIKWAGWAVLCALAVGWAGWVSLLAISNSTTIVRTEERQANQYEQLRDDLAEIKRLIQKP